MVKLGSYCFTSTLNIVPAVALNRLLFWVVLVGPGVESSVARSVLFVHVLLTLCAFEVGLRFGFDL